VHDLVRETLYAELSTAERLRWHQRVGEMLEQVHAADPDVHLAELSYHFCHAAPLGAMDKAIDYTVRRRKQRLRNELICFWRWAKRKCTAVKAPRPEPPSNAPQP
jgi:hypothetical protein